MYGCSGRAAEKNFQLTDHQLLIARPSRHSGKIRETKFITIGMGTKQVFTPLSRIPVVYNLIHIDTLWKRLLTFFSWKLGLVDRVVKCQFFYKEENLQTKFYPKKVCKLQQFCHFD